MAAGSGGRLGRYQLRRVLGHGGMGIVYEAYDTELRRRVALKVVREDRNGIEGGGRFLREAAIVAQLRHPNIVAIYDSGSWKESSGTSVRCIAMEYVEGRTLGDLLSEGETSREELVRILGDAARAVAYANDSGVLHRDLKPANILIESSGRVVLVDFGLARSQVFASRLTGSREVFGTPQYMSPEQAEGRSRECDARTDIYALGVILYEILTGRLPYEGATPAQLCDRIAQGDVPLPSRIKRQVPKDLEAVCLKAMAREPRERYATASLLAEDLGRFRRGEAIEARSPGWISRTRRRWARRRGIVVVILSSILLSGAGAAIGVHRAVRRQEFLRARESAFREHSAGRYEASVQAAKIALGISSDPELARLFEEDRAMIEEQKKLRELSERRRDFEKTRIVPALEATQDFRRLSYLRNANLEAKRREVEEKLAPLEEGTAQTLGRDFAPLWKALGIGWYSLGRLRQAELALARACELSPEDPQVNLALGMLLLERASEDLRVSNHSKGWLLSYRPELYSPQDYVRRASVHIDRAAADSWSNPIDRVVARAYQAYVSQRREEAALLCEEGLRTHGKELGTEDLWLLLGRIRPSPEALKALSEALDLRFFHPMALLCRARVRGDTGDYAGAIEDCDRLLRVCPKMAEAYLLRGSIRWLRKDLVSSTADYSSALDLDPAFQAAQICRGFNFIDLGDYSAAIKDALCLIRMEPKCYVAYEILATAYRSTGDRIRGIVALTQGILHYPDDSSFYDKRGVLWKELGDASRAISDFTEAIRRNPRNGHHYSNRAAVWYSLGAGECCADDMREAIRLRPHEHSLYSSRADLWTNYGRHDLAAADLTEAIKLRPGDIDLLRRRISARFEARDYAGSSEDCSRVLRLRPKAAEVYFGRGRARAMTGDHVGAIADHTAAIGLQPHHAAGARRYRGLSWAQLGMFPEAIRDLTRATEALGDLPEIWWDIAKVRHRGGDIPGAIEDLTRALERAPANWAQRVQIRRELEDLRLRR